MKGRCPSSSSRSRPRRPEETQERIAVEQAAAECRPEVEVPDRQRHGRRPRLPHPAALDAVAARGDLRRRTVRVARGPRSARRRRPQPPKLASTFDPGVTADIHLGSLATSAASGIWRQFAVQFGQEPDDRHQGRAARHPAEGRGHREDERRFRRLISRRWTRRARPTTRA